MFKCCYLDFVYCDFDVDYLVFENQISFSCHLFLSANVRHTIGAVRLGLVDSKDVIEELDTEEMKAIPEINMLLQEALIRNCRPSRSSALALEKGKPRSMNSVGEKVFKFARKRCWS